MKKTNEIIHLKVYKLKTQLPTDDKSPSMYSIAFVNNRTYKSIPNLIEHPILYNNFKYQNFFIDRMYAEKIGTRQFRKVNGQLQQEVYDYVSENVKHRLMTHKQFENLKKRNVYIDFHEFNRIFMDLTSRLSYIKIPELYVDYIKSKLNDSRYSEYKNKMMFIDVEDWLSVTSKNKKDKALNPMSIIYYLLRRNPEKVQELGNIDIIFYNKDSVLRINPSELNGKMLPLYKREMAKLTKNLELFDLVEDDNALSEIEIDNTTHAVVKDIFASKFNFVGDTDDEDITDVVEDIVDTINDIQEKTDKTSDEPVSVKEVEDAILNNQELLRDIASAQQTKRIGTKTALSKRDELLREKQKDLTIKGKTLKELQEIVTTNAAIEVNDIEDKIGSTNPNINKVRFTNFEKSYNDNLYKKDVSDILLSLNDKSLPVFVKDIKIEDSSDNLNLKETYTVHLEDVNRVRHTLKFDMPVFLNDKFMYMGGNKKLIIKQKFLKPIIKTGIDECQIVSNYNKIFIRRSGTKVSSETENLKKILDAPNSKIQVEKGKMTTKNSSFVTTIELDELAKYYKSIKTTKAKFIFNLSESKDIAGSIKDNQICVGMMNGDKTPILLNLDSQLIEGTDSTLIEYIVECLPEETRDDFSKMKSGKKFIYNKATMMGKDIPLILVLSSCEGLLKVLEKAEINYTFSDKRIKINSNQGIIQFSDGYLVYDKYPMKNSLLMNAFADIPTRAFAMGDFETKEAYASIFSSMFGNANLVNAILTFYEFMIDPITKEVLEDLGYPTDFVSVLLVGNELLSDNNYPNENDLSNYRVRSNEIVNGILHREIADAYAIYRDTAYNNNPKKISVPQDAVIKKLMMQPNVEDYSILNPIVELEKTRAITSKGYVGVNMDKAYNEAKRSYDDSMLGVMSVSTSPDANVGVVRQLTLEPTITGARGYIEDRYKDVNNVKDTNIFSPAELLSPLGASRDDTTRTAMATKQSKHIIPVAKSSPVLISNGAEQVIQYNLSDDFVVVAKEDGVVEEVNDETGLIVLKYKDGTHKAINTNPRVVKNGAGGFYLSNKLRCELKVGQKFKKNDVLASDNKFFSETMEGNKFNIGSLQKVAILSTAASFEDSSFITNKLSKDMSSEIVMQKAVTIGKNANIDKMVKVGDSVQVGDELLRIEQSFQEDAMNNLLSSVGDELGEEIKSLGQKPIKSKYSGVIEDIKIYSTVDLEEMSPSLRKLVSDYYKKIEKKKHQLDKYDKTSDVYKCGMLLTDPIGKVETKDGKIKGNQVDEGVLIEFYIKYKDSVGIGDKICYFTALKSIVGQVIEEGYEPYSEFRPEEEISTSVAPGAVLGRMTPSIIITMLGNKCLMELKRSLENIYNS